ncbi:cupin domain-containing protein [Chitinophaga pendula]|uniref:cupin domain-containing protein n=1 Tax=Chitinophaga TaxID=79328 RepID=UPI000BAF6CB8|nr:MULTISPECIES: cupin domain-containing protein [Chitinophaga]ASZ11954.1 hypothetical protein CK934_13790 [Chitinophaga sp. MD30]UCJ05018.1 cupin domain-containing protein [Chitinophaga pendula]
MNTTFGFHQLIAPLKKGEFISEYFEKKPLIIKRNNKHYFDNLLTLAATDQIIDAGTRHADLKLTMSHAGKKIVPEDYTNSWHTEKVSMQTGVNREKLFNTFTHDKATMIIHNAASYHATLNELVVSMEQEFNCNSGVNLFVTPANAQCFQWHYDEHDLFIIQIAGNKHWKIFESAVYLPFEPQNRKQVDFSGLALLHDVCLEPGDLLYLPRGYVHEVITTDVLSCHVTLGILNTSWIKRFADYITHLAYQDPLFRRSYITGMDIPQQYKEDKINSLKQQLLQKISEEELLAFFYQHRHNTAKPSAMTIPSLAALISDHIPAQH